MVAIKNHWYIITAMTNLLDQFKKFAFPIFAAVVISFFLSVMLIRLCSSTGFRFFLSPTYLFCGTDAASNNVTFKKLTAAEVAITSNINESEEFSVKRNTLAKNLIDGDLQTLAAPANTQLDYTIKFLNKYQIKQIIIHWKNFGESKEYVNVWSLNSISSGGGEKIASGEFPNTDRTIIDKKINAAELRITAESEKNWIGIYEIEIIGRPI